MIFRKVGLGAVIISLALLLSSCVEVRGDLSVSSAARINGEIIYTLNKSLAAGVGLSSLADVKSEASTNPEAQIGLCKDAPITEDASNYILKCPLKDVLTDSGEISASITGGTIVFRYKANLDSSSTSGDQTNFGSVSITIRFLDPVISFKENKVGLVTRVDNLTYRISGSANEPMNIEITANLAAGSGTANTAPTPVPSTTATAIDQAAADAALKAAADKAAADLKAKEEADAKAVADLMAKQDAEAAEAKAAAEKAAADLKAKQEAEAKAAADLKAKQEAEAKAAADKAAADLKAKQEAEAKAAADKAAADLKTKQEAEAKAAADKAAADLKAKKAAEAKAAAAKILAAAKAKAAAAAAASKKTTITCIKGKLTKKVTAVKPVCPKGYKKK
jgi:chemotaxis protein histidine kinase CheA